MSGRARSSAGSAAPRRRGILLALSSPSGAGKTSIARRLLETEAGLELSISATTRQPRAAETDGRDYHFVKQARFDQMVEQDEFLEHARVFDHLYGTPVAEVMAKLEGGIDVLLDIDWQGRQQVASRVKEDLVSVFILPPSRQALLERLRSRGQDSSEVIASRMRNSSGEISHYLEYDYVVINDRFDASVERVRAILLAERLRRHRQRGIEAFVEALIDDDGNEEG